MNTLHLPADQNGMAAAGTILQNGGLVAIPTETVYGLAANAFDSTAVSRIFTAKGRPQDNPLIVHIADLAQLDLLFAQKPDALQKLADAFWPGPLTVICQKNARVPDAVTCGMDTVAVRFPSDEVAQAIIHAAGVPLAAPSANLSGSPSPTTAQHCVTDLDGRVDAIVMGGDCKVGVESTVITLAGDVPRVLRPGAVTVEMLAAVLGEVEVDPAVTEQLAEGAKVLSPGMKYKHYAPRAHVVMLSGSGEAYTRYLQAHPTANAGALCFDEDLLPDGFVRYRFGKRDDHLSQAQHLFERLREADDDGICTLYAHTPATDGVGLAVYNRLIRAAGFEVIQLD